MKFFRFSPLVTNLSQALFHPIGSVVLGMSVTLGALLFQLHVQQTQNALADQARYLKHKQQWLAKQLIKEEEMTQRLRVADRDFIEKYLESLQLQAGEIKKMRTLLHANPQHDAYQSRLGFLTGKNNRLCFKQQNFQSQGTLREVELIQKWPVEVDSNDIASLLATIENRTIAGNAPIPRAPDLQIKRFLLQKKPLDLGGHAYYLQLDLIKREMINE